MLVELDEVTHTYTTEQGIVIPGFSEIAACVGTRKKIEDGYTPWNSVGGGEFCQDETAQNFGTALHAWIAYRLKDIECDYDKRIEPWINGFEKYIDDNGWIMDDDNEIMIELPIGSKLYGYAGCPDLFFNYRAKKTPVIHLFDWKSSTAMLVKKWRIQLASYAQLITEHFWPGKKVIRHAVRIFENGYQEDIRNGCPEDWYQFQSILNVYNLGRN